MNVDPSFEASEETAPNRGLTTRQGDGEAVPLPAVHLQL